MRQKQVDFAFFDVFFLCVGSFAARLLSMWNIRHPKREKWTGVPKIFNLFPLPLFSKNRRSGRNAKKGPFLGHFAHFFVCTSFSQNLPNQNLVPLREPWILTYVPRSRPAHRAEIHFWTYAGCVKISDFSVIEWIVVPILDFSAATRLFCNLCI